MSDRDEDSQLATLGTCVLMLAEAMPCEDDANCGTQCLWDHANQRQSTERWVCDACKAKNVVTQLLGQGEGVEESDERET